MVQENNTEEDQSFIIGTNGHLLKIWNEIPDNTLNKGNYIIAKLAEDGIVLRNSSGNAAAGKSIYMKSQGIYNQVRKYRRHLKRNQEKLDGYLSERLDQFDSVSMLNQSSGSAAEEPALTDAEVTRSQSETTLEGDISAVAAIVRQQNQGTTSISESNGAESRQAERSSSGDPNQGALDTASLQRAKTSDSDDQPGSTKRTNENSNTGDDSVRDDLPKLVVVARMPPLTDVGDGTIPNDKANHGQVKRNLPGTSSDKPGTDDTTEYTSSNALEDCHTTDQPDGKIPAQRMEVTSTEISTTTPSENQCPNLRSPLHPLGSTSPSAQGDSSIIEQSDRPIASDDVMDIADGNHHETDLDVPSGGLEENGMIMETCAESDIDVNEVISLIFTKCPRFVWLALNTDFYGSLFTLATYVGLSIGQLEEVLAPRWGSYVKWDGLLQKGGNQNSLRMPNGDYVVWIFVGCGFAAWFTPGDQMSPTSHVSLSGGWGSLHEEDKATWTKYFNSGDMCVIPPSNGWDDGKLHLELERRINCPYIVRVKRRKLGDSKPSACYSRHLTPDRVVVDPSMESQCNQDHRGRQEPQVNELYTLQSNHALELRQQRNAHTLASQMQQSATNFICTQQSHVTAAFTTEVTRLSQENPTYLTLPFILGPLILTGR